MFLGKITFKPQSRFSPTIKLLHKVIPLCIIRYPGALGWPRRLNNVMNPEEPIASSLEPITDYDNSKVPTTQTELDILRSSTKSFVVPRCVHRASKIFQLHNFVEWQRQSRGPKKTSQTCEITHLRIHPETFLESLLLLKIPVPKLLNPSAPKRHQLIAFQFSRNFGKNPRGLPDFLGSIKRLSILVPFTLCRIIMSPFRIKFASKIVLVRFKSLLPTAERKRIVKRGRTTEINGRRAEECRKEELEENLREPFNAPNIPVQALVPFTNKKRLKSLWKLHLRSNFH